MSAASMAHFVLFAALGAAVGTLYFRALRLNARLYLAGTGIWRPIALHLLRLLGAVAGFVAIAPSGGGALLSALAGFLLARALVVRPLGEADG
jgi:F1F0 ATPase subunit 2